MSALVVDTSSWVSYLGGADLPAIDDALLGGQCHLPPIVAAELLSCRLTKKERRELEDFLRDLPLCGVNQEHWFAVGALRARLAAAGFVISTPDAHVAQCSLDLNARLLSQDAIFGKVAKLIALKLEDRLP